ncbi:DUF7535 family protein [Haloarcula litorea]|uniref:DUF7535 family protein n=1 Tax=Haloarcula litorea TaxID=3032579 RepID=UPI0023E8BC34|nr:hypothetical protein [Halomicroarcula sp. GDY20]
MSDGQEPTDAGILPEPLRSVTPPTGYRPDTEMDAIGWSLFLGLLILLVPLLPFILIAWALARVGELLTGGE